MISGSGKHSIETLRNRIIRDYARLKTWRAVADKYGVTCGMVYRIAVNNYEPRDAHIRTALELPAMAPAPVCKICGEIHVTKRCTSHGARPRPRRAINLSDPVSAAATIRAHAEPEFVAELVRLLEVT
ncbi:MAG: hypothetical protein WC455_14210 [Dehalococcoidia bacterium]